MPTVFAVDVPAQGSVAQLRAGLLQLAGLPNTSAVVLADVYKSKIYKVLPDTALLSTVRDSDVTVAFQQDAPSESDPAQLMLVQAVHEFRADAASARVFGTPLVLELPRRPTGSQVWSLVARRTAMWLPPDLAEPDALLGVPAARLPFVLRVKDRAAAKCGLCRVDNALGGGGAAAGCGGLGCPIGRSDRPCGLTDMHSVVLDWAPGALAQQAAAFDRIRNHASVTSRPSVAAPSGSSSSSRGAHAGGSSSGGSSGGSSNTVTLYDCVQAFIAQEQLGRNDAWYCARCKKHVLASKKLDLWRHAPED
jgi:hypothetical protein